MSTVKLMLVSVALVALPLSVVKADDATIEFNRDVRPILSENCYHCHGPDEETRAADLRLDTSEGAKEYAIVEGDASASDLFDRISADDPDMVMPPPDSERKLSKEQIETIRRWIDQGAKYQSHWSFRSPTRPALPQADSTDLAIDQFTSRMLEKKGWQRAERADRETLIRRATFDLIGLPPTIEEIDEFLADDSPDAYGKLLDRLMERPEFGERMASDWLDAARYSDTYGYQVDRDRFVWPWRDWVIGAINDNLPYDKFLTWQLAGDLLPDATQDQVLATTFNRLHPQKVEGGSVPEEFRIEYVADRTQTIGTAMLGLTLECCRCHNHKYDPLSQRDYYQLTAFFDNIDEAGLYSYFTPSIPTPTLTLPNDNEKESLTQKQAAVDAARDQLAKAMSDRADAWKEAWGKIDQEQRFAQPVEAHDFDGDVKGPNESVEGVFGKAIELTGDDAVKTKVGNFSRYQPFSVSLWIKTPNHKDRAVVFHRSRAWTDAASRGYQLLIEDGKLSWSLIHFWPGNAIRIRTKDAIAVDQWMHVVVTNDGSSRAGGLGLYINGKAAEIEIVRDSLTKHITGGGGNEIAIGERFRDRGFKNGSVDQFEVYDKQLSELEILRLFDADTIAFADGSSEGLTESQAALLADHFLRRHDEPIQTELTNLLEARKAFCGLQDKVKEIMVMREMETPRQTYLLGRGAYDNRTDEVAPGTPAALPPLPQELPQNRLGFSKWLTDPSHPLTSRVAVNRLWQICFGTGLVRTPEDFGSQGEPPTHPDLLDWLAIDFVENGWDVKRMLKQIMMSETYRQKSATDNEAMLAADPENRLLGHFPSYRLPAEMLRDNSLAISGRLVTKIGGPPVKPYEIEASFKPSKRDKGDGLYRRSIYTYWKRTGPAPAMMALDAAKRDVCRVQRERTSSPIQAFVLLNGPQFVESARGLAEQLLGQYDKDELAETLQHGFRRLTSRRASEDEIRVLKTLFTQQLDYFQSNQEKTKAFLSVGDAKANEKLDAPRLAALTVVISTVMNFDQSVMKR